MKRIYFTVTNDLLYDQRMHRICTSLCKAGFEVMLVGRRLPGSLPLPVKTYRQKRLRCFFQKGFLFYGEYNLRLFFYLLTKKTDGICAIDLDTILPCLFISKLKRTTRIYDAHEYFTELKEVRTRPVVKRFWTGIERFAIPEFKLGYTVSEGLASEFRKNYNSRYKVIRNLPVLQPLSRISLVEEFLVYQGAVNEGRGFEILVPAMKMIAYKLVICGDGNFIEQLKTLIAINGVADKVELKGMLLPDELRTYAAEASLGIGLAEREGLNQYQALPNKFLEYIHAGLPQITMNFPEYKKINDEYKVAILLDKLTVDGVAKTINETMANEMLRKEMTEAAMKAREVFCWQREEVKLVEFYKRIFS